MLLIFHQPMLDLMEDNYRQKYIITTIKIIVVIFFMKVKLFDENHELDLEKSVNKFLKEKDIELFDIKYQVA